MEIRIFETKPPTWQIVVAQIHKFYVWSVCEQTRPEIPDVAPSQDNLYFSAGLRHSFQGWHVIPGETDLHKFRFVFDVPITPYMLQLPVHAVYVHDLGVVARRTTTRVANTVRVFSIGNRNVAKKKNEDVKLLQLLTDIIECLKGQIRYHFSIV